MSLIRPIKSNIIIKLCDKFVKSCNTTLRIQKVNDTCYKSTQPVLKDIPVIAQKGIKTIINLRTISKNEAQKFAKEAEKFGMKYINIQLNPFNIKKSISYILDTIKKSSKENPMLVHCTFSKDRTGFVTALNRIIKEGLPLKDAVNDMEKQGFNKFLFSHMNNFLKRFLKSN